MPIEYAILGLLKLLQQTVQTHRIHEKNDRGQMSKGRSTNLGPNKEQLMLEYNSRNQRSSKKKEMSNGRTPTKQVIKYLATNAS